MWFWLKSVLVAGKVAGDVANFTDNFTVTGPALPVSVRGRRAGLPVLRARCRSRWFVGRLRARGTGALEHRHAQLLRVVAVRAGARPTGITGEGPPVGGTGRTQDSYR